MSVGAYYELYAIFIKNRPPIFSAKGVVCRPFNFGYNAFALSGSMIKERNVAKGNQVWRGCNFRSLENIVKPGRLKFTIRFSAGDPLELNV